MFFEQREKESRLRRRRRMLTWRETVSMWRTQKVFERLWGTQRLTWVPRVRR
jgi:hypothetical protein